MAKVFHLLAKRAKRFVTIEYANLGHNTSTLITTEGDSSNMLLKALIILREIQSKSSPNFMIISITYPNLLHGSMSMDEVS